MQPSHMMMHINLLNTYLNLYIKLKLYDINNMLPYSIRRRAIYMANVDALSLIIY